MEIEATVRGIEILYHAHYNEIEKKIMSRGIMLLNDIIKLQRQGIDDHVDRNHEIEDEENGQFDQCYGEIVGRNYYD